MEQESQSSVDTTTTENGNDSQTTKGEQQPEPESESKGTGSFDPSNFHVRHPLQNRWTWWYDNPGKKTSQSSWGEYLKPIMSFDTVEDFWRLYNNIYPPSQLVSGSDYHLFKEGIEPKWEDPLNEKGGKWVVTLPNKNRKETSDKMWLYLVLACIGEGFALNANDEICGCVISIRKTQDKIALWTKNANNDEAVRGIGKHLRQVLELPAQFSLGYQAHFDATKNNSSFNNKNRYEA